MKLRTIMEQEDISLSSMQKYILLVIHTSQTPVLAFDRIRDTEPDTIASDMLDRYGYIRLYENEAHLTSKGQEALTSYGLVDEGDDVTEMGQDILDNYEE